MTQVKFNHEDKLQKFALLEKLCDPFGIKEKSDFHCTRGEMEKLNKNEVQMKEKKAGMRKKVSFTVLFIMQLERRRERKRKKGCNRSTMRACMVH